VSVIYSNDCLTNQSSALAEFASINFLFGEARDWHADFRPIRGSESLKERPIGGKAVPEKCGAEAIFTLVQ
jgi:hypothetical protein